MTGTAFDNLSDLSGEVFANEFDALIGGYELRAIQELRPLVIQLLSDIDVLVEVGEPITDDQLERLTGPLNERTKDVLSIALETMQVEMRTIAGSRGELTAVAPMRTGSALLVRTNVDGVSAAQYFQRRSPSAFMRSMMDAARRGIEAGWTRSRDAVATAVQRIVGNAVEGVLISGGFFEVTENWKTDRYRWITKLDEKVCPQCGPKHGTIFVGIENGPRYVTHYWGCRCIADPVDGVRT